MVRTIAAVLLAACATTPEAVQTETVMLPIVVQGGNLLMPNIDDTYCDVPPLRIVIEDGDDTVLATLEREPGRGDVSQDPYRCIRRTVVSGVPASEFYRVTVSAEGYEGQTTVSAGEQAEVTLE